MPRRSAATKSQQRHPAERLNQLEIGIINLFVRVAPQLGQPRSVAEIYGLMFSSAGPLSFDDVIQRLQLSKGSVSYGLNQLMLLGAVKPIYVPGRRSQHYEVVADLGRLTVRLLRARIPPDLRDGPARLEGAARLAKRLPAAERQCLNNRLRLLQDWQRKVGDLLFATERILAPDSAHKR